MFESGDTITIIGTILAVGIGLAVMAWRMTSRLDRRIDNDKASADADRREWQRSMDEFRRQMQRLAERQSRVEGRTEAAE